ncbi:MAG: NFYB/HAP3 family transcription factor subunit [Nanoarchaeota archaeon]|nr:NFYB/HAP3 family transcription factor subunit [Nanoarchaeota archaeon]
MKKREKAISLGAMEKLLRQAGAPRVSDKAKAVMRDKLEEHAKEIGVKAVKFMQHSKRKTVKSKDIELAFSG